MYFDFEDYRPDVSRIDRAISAREGVLLSIVLHLVAIVGLLLLPELPDTGGAAVRIARQAALERQRQREARRFVFVQPRADLEALRPPDRGDDSDKNRVARAPRRAPTPSNPLPFARGNSPERVEADAERAARGRGPAPEARAAPAGARNGEGSQPERNDIRAPESPAALELPRAAATPRGEGGRANTLSGTIGEALRNLQRYVQNESFDNPQGGGGALGPSIQFDTKGVEFGPWIRRFVAQIKRNWFIPYAAMSMKGHVVVTFYVHKDGTISDLAVPGPCPVDAFNNAAYNALAASNPTQPLPPEYPADRAFFTVTFYYNEAPPTP